MRIHDIRHTYASLLLQNGESMIYVRDQLGHASIQITCDTYGHLQQGANRNAVNRLDDPATDPDPPTLLPIGRRYTAQSNLVGLPCIVPDDREPLPLSVALSNKTRPLEIVEEPCCRNGTNIACHLGMVNVKSQIQQLPWKHLELGVKAGVGLTQELLL